MTMRVRNEARPRYRWDTTSRVGCLRINQEWDLAPRRPQGSHQGSPTQREVPIILRQRTCLVLESSHPRNSADAEACPVKEVELQTTWVHCSRRRGKAVLH